MSEPLHIEDLIQYIHITINLLPPAFRKMPEGNVFTSACLTTGGALHTLHRNITIGQGWGTPSQDPGQGGQVLPVKVKARGRG